MRHKRAEEHAQWAYHTSYNITYPYYHSCGHMLYPLLSVPVHIIRACDPLTRPRPTPDHFRPLYRKLTALPARASDSSTRVLKRACSGARIGGLPTRSARAVHAHARPCMRPACAGMPRASDTPAPSTRASRRAAQPATVGPNSARQAVQESYQARGEVHGLGGGDWINR